MREMVLKEEMCFERQGITSSSSLTPSCAARLLRLVSQSCSSHLNFILSNEKGNNPSSLLRSSYFVRLCVSVIPLVFHYSKKYHRSFFPWLVVSERLDWIMMAHETLFNSIHANDINHSHLTENQRHFTKFMSLLLFTHMIT